MEDDESDALALAEEHALTLDVRDKAEEKDAEGVGMEGNDVPLLEEEPVFEALGVLLLDALAQRETKLLLLLLPE